VPILIGCSGWSYDDWVGRFYPKEMAKKKGEWFSYYARYFKTVEINSTFYRIPNEMMVKSWIAKGAAVNGFEYSLKFPRIITHESLVMEKGGQAARQGASFEGICVEPLAESGLLGAVLIQLSPYFRNEADSLASLSLLLDTISCDRFSYAVEFRHRSWLDPSAQEIVPEVLDLLREHGVANVLVDGPGFPITREVTATHGYIRFHGRNYDIWFADEREDDHRINRYDYLYSEAQLRAWKSIIDEVAERANEVRIYFNNHGRAKAVRNAFQMASLLRIPHPEKEVRLQDQMTLGSYDGRTG